jgi:hypothetical protein
MDQTQLQCNLTGKCVGPRSELLVDQVVGPTAAELHRRVPTHRSPVKGDFRLSRVPMTVGEEALGADCTVMVINGAANRDPRRSKDPDSFDPDRKNDVSIWHSVVAFFLVSIG